MSDQKLYVVSLRPKPQEDDELEILNRVNIGLIGIYPTLEEAKAVAKAIPVYFEDVASKIVGALTEDKEFDEEKMLSIMSKNNAALFFQYQGVEVTAHELSTLNEIFFPDPESFNEVVKKVASQVDFE